MAERASAQRRRNVRYSGRNKRVAQARQQVQAPGGSTSTSTSKRTGTGPICPQDPKHGALNTWSRNPYMYWCEDEAHTGFRFIREKDLPR